MTIIYQWRKRGGDNPWHDSSKREAFSRVDDQYEARRVVLNGFRTNYEEMFGKSLHQLYSEIVDSFYELSGTERLYLLDKMAEQIIFKCPDEEFTRDFVCMMRNAKNMVGVMFDTENDKNGE